MLHKALLDIVPCACSLRMYNSVVERCFKDCVESFRRKDLEASEEKVCQYWEVRRCQHLQFIFPS